MSLLVWTMMGIAIWHFAVFAPDHFRGGIVGAFGASLAGAVIVGIAVAGGDIEDTSLVTALEAVLGASYFWGLRAEQQHA